MTDIEHRLDIPLSCGIIAVRVDPDQDDTFTSTSITSFKNKFSTRAKTNYKIESDLYPDINCIIYDDYRATDVKYNLDNTSIECKTEAQMTKFIYYRSKIQFLMVSRKYSVGYSDFVRGRYNPTDANSIIGLFEQMTDREIKEIETNSYDDLAYKFTNRHNEDRATLLNKIYTGRYADEYCSAKIKFGLLKNSDETTDGTNNIPWSLSFYTQKIKPKWITAEWGWPKGRPIKKEDHLVCARREFEEETGYTNYLVLDKINPVIEILTGTDSLNYKHIYYVALGDAGVSDDSKSKEFDQHETEEAKWLSYDEAIDMIRPYHKIKRNILTQVYMFVLDYLVNVKA